MPTRLIAKMSYTNIGFALAPKEFAFQLRDIYGAALGYQATNPERVLGPSQSHHPNRNHRAVRLRGIARAALYRFTDAAKSH